MSSDYVVVLCTVPSADKGAEMARPLIEEKLIACANIVDGLRSLYLWKGEVCDDPEALLIMKTRRDRFQALDQRLAELHPYETPEIIALPLADGHEPYLRWIDDCVG